MATAVPHTRAGRLAHPLPDGAARPDPPHRAGHPRRQGTSSRPVDERRAAQAAAELLAALGLDPHDPDLVDTPERMAALFAELLTPESPDLTTFPNDGLYDELVLVTGIPFTSLCARHLLPFRGVAHVGYLPGDRLVGLSKLARLVDAFARRPQVQTRLTAQIAESLQSHLAARGVGVIVEAERLCASAANASVEQVRTVTSALHGVLRDDPNARRELLTLVRGG